MRSREKFSQTEISGACFSKVFRVTQFSLYLQNEGVSRHETLQLFLFLTPLQHTRRPALQNKQAGVLRMAFRARKAFGTFEKRAPAISISLLTTMASYMICIDENSVH